MTDLALLQPLLDGWHITAGDPHRESRIEDSAWIAVIGAEAVGWLQGHHRQDCIWRRIVGYEGRPDGWCCTYLSLMYVDPSQRCAGVGSALLSAFEQDARDAGNSLVILNPSEADSATLSRFYERNGYSVRPGSRGNPTYLMAKDLD